MKQLYDVKTAAGLLCISPWTLRSYIAKGRIKPVRIGRRVLLDDTELQEFVDRGKNNGEEAQCQKK
jgi:excisionase family DNA binding protein